MGIKKIILTFFLFATGVLNPFKLGAQSYAFIYIESDKDLTYNVISASGQATHFSKHYCFLPKLIPGTNKIYIVFPNNEYAPLRFMIEVPEKGFRNFLLTRYEGSISMYDMQNMAYQSGEMVTLEQVYNDFSGLNRKKTHYLQDDYDNNSTDSFQNQRPGSAPVAIKSFANDNVQPTYRTQHTEQTIPSSLDSEALADYYNNPVNNPNRSKPNPYPARQTGRTDGKLVQDPNFPDKGSLDSETLADYYNNPVNNPSRTKKPQTTADDIVASKPTSVKINNYSNSGNTLAPASTPAATTTTTSTTTITKVRVRKLEVGNCIVPISEKIYDDIYITTIQKNEKVRLKYLLTCLNNCYSCSQIRVLATTLATDPERYAFLKQAYPHVSDKGNFPALESTITKKEWKDYFKLIAQ
jgi:hypothetical protein